MYALLLVAGFGISTSVISVKAVAVAGVVFAALQVVKKFTNWSFLSGNWAIAANVALSVVGTISTTATAQIFTTSTLVAILTTAFLAAGLHGVATTVSPSIIGNAPKTPSK